MRRSILNEQILSDKKLKKHLKRAKKNKRLSKRREANRLRRLREKKLKNEIQISSKNLDQILISLGGDKHKASYLYKREHRVTIPKVFSIIENPEESINVIYQLATAKLNQRIRTLYVDHSGVERIGLAAEAVLDHVALELWEALKARRSFIGTRGQLPNDPVLEKYIRGIGIINTLDIEDKKLSDEELSGIRVFDRRCSTRARENKPHILDYKNHILPQFVDYINNCLLDHNRELKGSAKGELIAYVGEILGNAEDHSGQSDWTIIGYLDNALPGHHRCEIAIFNFGKTFAETFEELDEDSYAYNEIKPFIDAHSKKRIFSKSWTKEDLITVAALQGQISSKNYNSLDTRGRGTVDLITFFQGVAEECSAEDAEPPLMAILSGRTHILFDGTYRMTDSSKSERQIIAFNENNDLNSPPDPRYVKHLSTHAFPGTIISIRFPLSPSNLKEAELDE